MAFKQLLIRKDERRLDNPLSAFICVNLYERFIKRGVCAAYPNTAQAEVSAYMRLKNKRDDLYHQQISAPICSLNTFFQVLICGKR